MRRFCWFGPRDGPALEDFWRIYDRHAGEVFEAGLRARQLDPEFSPSFGSDEALRTARDVFQRRDALARAGQWDELEQMFIEQGRLYARRGVSFSAWHALGMTALNTIAPHLIRAYHLEPDRLGRALAVARHIVDGALVVVATEYIRAREDAVQEGEERLRLFVQAVTEYALYTLDESGVIVSWNAGAERIKRCRAEEALGQHVSVFYSPADRAAGKPARDLAAAAERGTVEEETWRVRGDGSSFRASTVMTAIRDRDGRVVGFGKVVRDITDRTQAADRIAASEAQLRALASRLRTAQEEERRRIAREIHDELGQQLTGLKMDAVWLRRRLGSRESGGIAERIDGMTTLLDSTIHTVRRIATDLRPSILDDLGLLAAMEWQARRFQERSGIRVSIASSSTDVGPAGNERATALFRIFQEALTNIGRHSGARTVEVLFEVRDGSFTLEIQDDGRGISAAEAHGRGSLGLLGMKERASLLGGRFAIRGEPGQGTRVTVVLPSGEEHA